MAEVIAALASIVGGWMPLEATEDLPVELIGGGHFYHLIKPIESDETLHVLYEKLGGVRAVYVMPGQVLQQCPELERMSLNELEIAGFRFVDGLAY